MADSPANGEASTIGPHEANAMELIESLDDLTDGIASSGVREEIQEAKDLLATASDRGLIDSGLRILDSRDVAEAFVGSVIFAAPLLVEDGVFDIADHLFQFTVGGIPVFLLANTAFVVLMTYALLQWTGRDEVETHTLFGVVPTRVVMVLGVSFVVSAILMTVWGRVGDWNPPIEAIARINVLWTVGSLGAALGDVLSGDDSPGHEVLQRRGEALASPETSAERVDELSDAEVLTALQRRFDQLEARVQDEASSHEIELIKLRTDHAALTDRFGQRIRKYTPRDIAEAFVGSIFFSIPFLVEDGVFAVADYFLSFRIGQFPVFFLLNAGFVLFMVSALVYWAGPQDVRVSRPILGVIPRRLVGISLVSFLTAAALMTMWGRVDNWVDPVVAIARISVVWTVASFGGALGDILPGESSGDDIYDELADLEDLMDGADE